jgi:hypothetical protein
MLRFGIAGLALAVGVVAAAAQDMKSPRIAPTHVDWDAVVVDLDAPDVPKPVVVPEVMAKLNRATSEHFANIAASPVPVLLPFDTAAFARPRRRRIRPGRCRRECAGRHLSLRFQRGAVLLSRAGRL